MVGGSAAGREVEEHAAGVADAARDRGAASLMVLAIGLVLIMMGVAGAAVGAARVGRHQARAAADLGALAGAAQAIQGPGVACATADRFVTANGARMTGCEVDGLEIVVRVELAVAIRPGPIRYARAAAGAGPVSAIG
jgi:secretion/DNA translocation related TadE-like protein